MGLIDKELLIQQLKCWNNKGNTIPSYAWKCINEANECDSDFIPKEIINKYIHIMDERMHTYKDHPEISKYYQDSIDILTSLLNDFQEEYMLNEFIKAEEKLALSNEAFCEAHEKLSKTSAHESFKNQAEYHKLLVKWLKELQGRRRYDKKGKYEEYCKSIIKAQKELEECRRGENNTSNEINDPVDKDNKEGDNEC